MEEEFILPLELIMFPCQGSECLNERMVSRGRHHLGIIRLARVL